MLSRIPHRPKCSRIGVSGATRHAGTWCVKHKACQVCVLTTYKSINRPRNFDSNSLSFEPWKIYSRIYQQHSKFTNKGSNASSRFSTHSHWLEPKAVKELRDWALHLAWPNINLSVALEILVKYWGLIIFLQTTSADDLVDTRWWFDLVDDLSTIFQPTHR